jgi:hypothetical protein
MEATPTMQIGDDIAFAPVKNIATLQQQQEVR